MDKILLLIDRGLNAFLYSNGEVEMVSLAELNDLIGKQQITVKNINNNLIASLYNKSDYGAEKTLNNILMNKNNISINKLLRTAFVANIKHKDIYLEEYKEVIRISYDYYSDVKYTVSKIKAEQIEGKCLTIRKDNSICTLDRAEVMNELVDKNEVTANKNLNSSEAKNELAVNRNSENNVQSSDKNDENNNLIRKNGSFSENDDSIEEKTEEQSANLVGSSDVKNSVEKQKRRDTVNLALNFEDDDESDEEDESNAEEELHLRFSEFDPECPYCHGTGVRELNGLPVECECGARVAERRKIEAELERKKAAENITEATRINAVSVGLIPEEYKDLEYNNKESLESIKRRANGRTIVGKKRYMAAMNSIIESCRTGVKLKHSYLLAGDKGFSKKTFVYTCLKHLFQRGARPVKYMSLSEIGLIRADVIKNAMAVSNTGYYFKDRDEEKIQMLMTKSVDLVMKSIIQKTYEATREGFRNEFGDDSAKALANYVMNFNDTKHGIDNNLSKIKDMNNKQLKGIANNIRSRVLEEVYAKYNSFKQNESEMNAEELDNFVTKQVDTWNDIVNTPILFTYLSGSLNKQFETEVLQMLLNERGNKCLPTIVMCDTSMQGYRDEFGYVEDMSNNTRISYIKARSVYWDNMISESSSFNLENADANKLDEEISSSIEYDRLVYINSYIKRETSVIPGVNI